jgi:cell division protease FtsH
VAEEHDRRQPGESLAPEELRKLARGLAAVLDQLRDVVAGERPDELRALLAAHLGVPPGGLPVVSEELLPYQLLDVQISLERWVTETEGRAYDLVGITGDRRRFQSLSELVSESGVHGVGPGPVDYVNLADSPDTTKSCVRFGMFLLRDGQRHAVALLRGADPYGPMQSAMLEVLTAEPGYAESLLRELRALAVRYSVLRGQLLGFGAGDGPECYGRIRFLRRPRLSRAELVLPEATLQQIEPHVIGIAEHRERLRAAGQHLKRGVLLYGPPGTGKTHTVRYLLGQLGTVTAFVLSGQSLGFIAEACALARLLQPSVVVLEDVDLIAPDRSFSPIGRNPLLFEVLNQIDGLGDDVDVTFLLTTNRVDILERALAERPGRIDAAVEIAPPDADGRARLFGLYGAALGVAELSAEDLSEAVGATEGRTATYIREVVRRAALLAAGGGDGRLRVDGHLLGTAARELLEDRSALTRALLGGPAEPDAEPPLQAGSGTRARSEPPPGWIAHGPRARPPQPNVFGAEDAES